MVLVAVSPALASLTEATPMPTAPSVVEPTARSVLLRCQINGSEWRPCRMVIDSIGEHWWLLVGPRRFEFHHDGRGNVTIGEGSRPARPVTPQWRSTGVLCWDGLCAEGPIPLD